MLRANQIEAINTSINNNFKSGIHFHATGTGKSRISHNIVLEFEKRNKNCIIFWITERKSILTEQFDYTKLKKENIGNIHDKFIVLDFNKNKSNKIKWYESIDISSYWNKSRLVIINRGLLTYNNNYTNIKKNIDLIVHDECHSIVNKSTQEFYSFILNKNPNIKCIGFTATPVTKYPPFTNILSKYSIYKAFKDKVILPPKIYLLKSNNVINYKDVLSFLENHVLKDLYYKKIIVWCGMIDNCYNIANIWNETKSTDFRICIDTSQERKCEKFGNYNDFYEIENNSILFCANKHREGSDIKNLDCCIFLDYVEDRYSQTFVQCIGRVIRKDPYNNKKNGIIIDVRAKNCYRVINKINKYLKISKKLFPWKYKKYFIDLNNKKILVNYVELFKKLNIKPKKNTEFNIKNTEGSINNLRQLFIREPPNNNKYKTRLQFELHLFKNKNLIGYLIRAVNILKLTDNIIHVTRGSCGSSLVCYLLGISHVDPVKYNINFARFLNEYRNTLPDIDFDFPHFMRDEVFLKLQINYPNKIARISNHIYYKEKSAKRKALQSIGYNKFISKFDIDETIINLDNEEKTKYMKLYNKLLNTFRCYSLHCGGIVYYPEGVPNKLKINENSERNHCQIHLNKYDISDDKIFKIDILSSRAVSQLFEMNDYNSVDFEDCPYDEKIYDMLSNGDNIGLTLAESPLIRKAFIKIQPKSIEDIAVCLAIIRPMAKDEINSDYQYNKKTDIIYDDDAIELISNVCKCDYAEADKIRRGFSKGDKEIIYSFMKKIRHLPGVVIKNLVKRLENLKIYGFCKSHSLSYAQLVYKLGYYKVYFPEKFWKSTLRNCVSSYKKWVHIYEGKLNGIDYNKDVLKNSNQSIYAENRRKKINNLNTTEQIKKYGYWRMDDSSFYPGEDTYYFTSNDKIYFKGLIANIKKNKNKTSILLGTGLKDNKMNYIELIIKNFKSKTRNYICIKGNGVLIDKDIKLIEVSKYDIS